MKTYELYYAEVKTICPKFKITEEEYNNYEI